MFIKKLIIQNAFFISVSELLFFNNFKTIFNCNFLFYFFYYLNPVHYERFIILKLNIQIVPSCFLANIPGEMKTPLKDK